MLRAERTERFNRTQRDFAGRDRAGLVETQRVDSSQQLNRSEFLGKRPATRQSDHSGDETQTR